ncbi:MAG: hypothetical protein ACLGIR_04395 [Actinomycetes bacterium]
MALALSGVLLLSACQGGGSGEPEASPRDVSTIGQPSETVVSSPSASAEAVDVTVVPDEITPAYVDAVANTLYGIADEVTVEILAEPADPTRNLTREQLDKLVDVFDGEEYVVRVGEVEVFAREPESRRLVLGPEEYEQLRWETVKILESSTACIVAVGYYDLSGTASQPTEPVLHALSLTRTRGTEQFNPTPWLVVDALANRSGGEVNPDEAMLEADLSSFGDALTHTCGSGS